jgi:DNA-binding FadR family transcriptional regulator
MELRRIAEPAAARLAALHATKNERQTMRMAFDDMERAVGGRGDYLIADLAFHTAIFSSCGNQFLRQMRNIMPVMLYGNFKLLEQKSGRPSFSLPVHLRLCQAIEAGDAEAAEQAALRVIEHAEKDLEELHGR